MKDKKIIAVICGEGRMNFKKEIETFLKNKIITHEEARNLVNELVPTDAITPSQIDDLHIYITQQEKKEARAKKVEKELEEIKLKLKTVRDNHFNYVQDVNAKLVKYEQLERDVKRYGELTRLLKTSEWCSKIIIDEYNKLENKLSKVGESK